MDIQTLKSILALVLFWVISSTSIYSQDLVYTPRNSAFGGNTLNHSWMLNNATSQNTFDRPSTGEDEDQFLNDFTQSLERQLLSYISREIFDAQFDPNQQGLEEGTFQFGNFLVDITDGVEGLIISINDFSSGGTTQITVPFF